MKLSKRILCVLERNWWWPFKTGIVAVMVMDAVLFAWHRENFHDTFFTVVYIRASWNCHTHFGKKIADSQNLLLLPQENGSCKNCLFVPHKRTPVIEATLELGSVTSLLKSKWRPLKI